MAVDLPEQEDDHLWLEVGSKLIAIVEVGAGLFGLYFLFSQILGASRVTFGLPFHFFFALRFQVFFVLAFVFYGLAIIAGVLLFRHKKLGVSVSLLVQALQLFQISVTGLVYHFLCGPEFLLGYYYNSDGFNFVTSWGLQSAFQLILNGAPVEAPTTGPNGLTVVSNPETYTSGINVVALCAIFCLLMIRSVTRGQSDASPMKPAT